MKAQFVGTQQWLINEPSPDRKWSPPPAVNEPHQMAIYTRRVLNGWSDGCFCSCITDNWMYNKVGCLLSPAYPKTCIFVQERLVQYYWGLPCCVSYRSLWVLLLDWLAVFPSLWQKGAWMPVDSILHLQSSLRLLLVNMQSFTQCRGLCSLKSLFSCILHMHGIGRHWGFGHTWVQWFADSTCQGLFSAFAINGGLQWAPYRLQCICYAPFLTGISVTFFLCRAEAGYQLVAPMVSWFQGFRTVF